MLALSRRTTIILLLCLVGIYILLTKQFLEVGLKRWRYFEVPTTKESRSNEIPQTGGERRRLPKYVSYLKSEATNFSCSTCAYVTGSGHMIDSKLGEEIDGHECVARSNDAVVTGYERDVGRRTTIRTVYPGSMENIHQKLNSGRLSDTSFPETVLVMCPLLDSSILNKSIDKFLKQHPRAIFYVHTPARARHIHELFAKEVGKLAQHTLMSNAFYSISFLKEICGTVDIYGITPPDYCSQGNKDVPYHYYSKSGMECKIIKGTKQHNFLNEKKAYQKWRSEWQNLEFYAPKWK